MSTLDKIKNTLVPSAFAGAASVGIYYFLFDKEAIGITVPFGPLEVPAWAALGGSVALGNMAGEILTDYVLPMIPKNENFQKYESTIIPPVLSGLASFGIMRTLVSPSTEFQTAFIVGAGGSVAGNYVYGMWK